MGEGDVMSPRNRESKFWDVGKIQLAIAGVETEEEATSQGIQASRNWNRQENGFSPRASERENTALQ